MVSNQNKFCMVKFLTAFTAPLCWLIWGLCEKFSTVEWVTQIFTNVKYDGTLDELYRMNSTHFHVNPTFRWTDGLSCTGRGLWNIQEAHSLPMVLHSRNVSDFLTISQETATTDWLIDIKMLVALMQIHQGKFLIHFSQIFAFLELCVLTAHTHFPWKICIFDVYSDIYVSAMSECERRLDCYYCYW